jgi:hypothetical protein
MKELFLKLMKLLSGAENGPDFLQFGRTGPDTKILSGSITGFYRYQAEMYAVTGDEL